MTLRLERIRRDDPIELLLLYRTFALIVPFHVFGAIVLLESINLIRL